MAAVVNNGARSPSNNDDKNNVITNNDTAVKSVADTSSDQANATKESLKTTDDDCSQSVTSAPTTTTTTRISGPLNLSQTNHDDVATSKRSSKPKSSLTCGYSVESILGHKYGGAKSAARQQPSSTGWLLFQFNLTVYVGVLSVLRWSGHPCFFQAEQ